MIGYKSYIILAFLRIKRVINKEDFTLIKSSFLCFDLQKVDIQVQIWYNMQAFWYYWKVIFKWGFYS